MARVFPSWDPGHPLESTVVVTRLCPRMTSTLTIFYFYFQNVQNHILQFRAARAGTQLAAGVYVRVCRSLCIRALRV